MKFTEVDWIATAVVGLIGMKVAVKVAWADSKHGLSITW